jgi:hypothetical protein
MKPGSENLPLPAVLEKYINSAGKTISTDEGDWEIEIGSPSSVIAKSLPKHALVIAQNGVGDYLILRPSDSQQSSFDEVVYVYWHEERKIEIFAQSIDVLLYPPPPSPTKHDPVYYYGGKIEVMLGDEVSARILFFRKNGRVAYVPGLSKKNRELERDGMAWVGIRFLEGSMSGAWVEPTTSWVKRSVRFIRRSTAPIDEIGPNERFD